MTFDVHCFVNEQADAFGKAGGALIGEGLQDVVQEIRIGGVGHVRLCVGWFARTQQETKGARPQPVSRARLACPTAGGGEGRRDNLQKGCYTDSESGGEWIKTHTDMLGMVWKIEYPDGAASTNCYNALELLALDAPDLRPIWDHIGDE